MNPRLLLRYAAMLGVVLLGSGLGGQVVAKKRSEQDADEVADDNIEVMTENTFTERVDSGLPMLVYFYTKWCGHCVTTGPMIVELAATMRDRHDLDDDAAFKVGKVDVEVEKNLASREGVDGFPTIRLYRDGRHEEFYGVRSVPTLVQWLERKMGFGVPTLKTMSEARKMFAAHPAVIVGFFEEVDSEEAAVFKATSTVMDSTAFALINDDKLLAEFGAADASVVVFKKFDEGRVDVNLVHTVDTLVKLLKRATRPLVADYLATNPMEHFTPVGTANRTVFAVFLSKRAGHYEQLHDTLLGAALEHVNNVSFVTVNVDEADHARVMDAFFVSNATAIPAMRIYSFVNGQRYKPTTDMVSGATVRAFIGGVQSGALQSIDGVLAAEPAAIEDENGVKVLTTANFDQGVYDGRHHTLVLFYTETCPHCTTFKPLYEEVASQLAEEPSLMLAKIDMSRFRPKSTGVNIVGVPYVVLYPRCDKEKPITYDGTRNSKNLLKFIKKHTGLEVRKKSRSAKKKAADEDHDEL